MRTHQSSFDLPTLLTILVSLALVGILTGYINRVSESVTISCNTKGISAQEIIRKNKGFSQKPSLQKIYNFFAIVREDSFSPEDYKKIHSGAKIWTEGSVPDRRHFIFQDDPILENDIKSCF